MKTTFFLIAFVTCISIPSAYASEGLTQKDTELLIELKVKTHEIDKRFEQVDKRLELMDKHMQQRFAQVDKRFELMNNMMEQGFEQVDKRFEQVDKKFEQMNKNMDLRFTQVDKKFEQMNKNMDQGFAHINDKFNYMFNFLWIITGIFTTLTVSVIGFAYWDRRTIIRKAKEETIEELKKNGLSVKLLEVLRKLAKEDSKLADVLRLFHLL